MANTLAERSGQALPTADMEIQLVIERKLENKSARLPPGWWLMESTSTMNIIYALGV